MHDTIMSADSFVDKYTAEIPAAPECSEIEFLLNSAENACLSYSFEEAHILLRKALVSIREKEESEKEWSGADSFYNKAARIYTEQMPGRYSDSIPDEISLLVFQKQLSRSLDTLKLSPNDSIILKKLTCQKGITYNFPIIFNERVYRSLYFFSKGEKGTLDKWFLRSSQYLPFMQRIFADSGLPTDLAYLPLIESGFNPLAYSHRQASGIWQFIASTGARFGLRINYWLDERRDPVKSTMAAASYLNKLYNQFSDWYLAVAAYNCGENSVASLLSRTPRSNYWQLSLPRETNNYVPEFISALIVAKNPECFGYPKARVGAFGFDTAFVNGCINLQAVSDSLGISLKELKTCNPHILHWCTPPTTTQVNLYLPKGLKGRFKYSFTQSPQAFRVSWYKYQVKPGQTLSSIARQFKVPLEALASINNFDVSSRLPNGLYVFIPIPVQVRTAETSIIAEDVVRNSKPCPVKSEKNGQIRYMVRSGDTIWELSRLFHISVRDICAWNNLMQNQRLVQGQFLILYTKERPAKEENIVPSPAVPLPVKPPSQARYEVLPGETLYSISRKLGIPVSELMVLNGIDTKNPVIFAGQNLFYNPGHRQAEKQPLPDTLFYKVCKGDNLHSLAQAFSVNVDDLIHSNNLSISSTLKVGDLIRIPVTKRAFSAPAQAAPQPATIREDHL
jgi:membrane-bound lytic murein transglycosylase D